MATRNPVVPSAPDRALSALAEAPTADPRAVLARFLARRSGETSRAYRGDLETFRAWLGVASMDDAAATLCAAHPMRLAALVLDFAEAQRTAGLTPATARRRVSTLRALTAAMRRAGATANVVDIDGRELTERAGRPGPMRDTAGPSLPHLAAMLREAAAQSDPTMAARDAAILWCLAGIGLRRAEVCSLQVDELDLSGDRPTARIKGKGRTAREAVTLPRDVAEALRAWIAVRPAVEHRAVFVVLDRVNHGAPATGSTIYAATRRLAHRAGVDPGRARPHGLRHLHGTQAARLTSGDAFKVRATLRHSSIATSQRYVDQEADLQGRVASAVASAIRAAL